MRGKSTGESTKAASSLNILPDASTFFPPMPRHPEFTCADESRSQELQNARPPCSLYLCQGAQTSTWRPQASESECRFQAGDSSVVWLWFISGVIPQVGLACSDAVRKGATKNDNVVIFAFFFFFERHGLLKISIIHSKAGTPRNRWGPTSTYLFQDSHPKQSIHKVSSNRGPEAIFLFHTVTSFPFFLWPTLLVPQYLCSPSSSSRDYLLTPTPQDETPFSSLPCNQVCVTHMWVHSS